MFLEQCICNFRELPEPVLESSELSTRFEQAASTKELAQRECLLAELASQQLAECNRVLLAWITLHLDHVTACVSLASLSNCKLSVIVTSLVNRKKRRK